MNVDSATLLGIALAVVGLVNAWMLFGQANLRGDMTKLRDADTALGTQIAAIREMVAGQYITRAEFNAALDRQTATILAAMNRIADTASAHQHNQE